MWIKFRVKLHKQSFAVAEALAMKNRLVLMDFITDQTENVYPMVAAGKGQHEMHLAGEDRELA